MSCNCISEISTKVKDIVYDQIKDEIGFQNITSFRFKNLPFIISGKEVSQKISMPFVVGYERIAKKSGKLRSYKKETSIFPTFCPFCGKKYDQ